MIIVIKATTPPTIPMITESIFASWDGLLCFGSEVGCVTDGFGLRVDLFSGSHMISSSDSVVVRDVLYVTSVVVVDGRPSQVNSPSDIFSSNFPARKSGALHLTCSRSSYNVFFWDFDESHLCKGLALQSQ